MPTILAIDDDPDMLATLRTQLLTAGFDVKVAGSAREAMNRLHASPERPDCIVTDIYMADGDGFELIGALKVEGFKIPVVAISGGSRSGHDPLEIADSLGVAATISKPFKARDLVETVKRVIGGTISQEAEHGNDVDGG
jgi:DNA-binding NtrC family response regulator